MKKDTFIKKILKIFLVLAGLVLALFLAIFGPIDRKHWKEKEAMAGKMDSSLSFISHTDTSKGKLKAGWGKVCILPSKPIPLASYGIREDYKSVHDSIWCRAIVLDNGIKRVAMVTVDLLIFPPVLAEKLKDVLKNKGYPSGNTFFSASHTHNAPGGWAENIGGRLLAGKYNEEYVSQLVQSVERAIELAENDLESSSIGFGKFEARKMIRNRYSTEEADVDHWLRLIKIRKASGKTGIVVSYAAHPNILSSGLDEVSGDYAGVLVNAIEVSGAADFAAFYAGAVGAHTCSGFQGENYEAIEEVSSYLKEIVLTNVGQITLTDSVSLSSYRIPLYMDEPQVKVSSNWKVRSWVFPFVLGEQEVFLSALKINNIVLIGTPCDFGGELVPEFSKVCEEKNLKLVVTSFNGGYVGYIIPDKYYDYDMRESRDMVWYGPHNAEYFVEIINKVLKKM